jgi:hypothetical protein
MSHSNNASAIDHASAHEDLSMTYTNYTLHYSKMTGLQKGAQYFYTLGCDGRWMRIKPKGLKAWPPAHREPIWAAYGDLGLSVDAFRELAPSIPVLAEEGQKGDFDGVIHAGDFAYAN